MHIYCTSNFSIVIGFTSYVENYLILLLLQHKKIFRMKYYVVTSALMFLSITGSCNQPITYKIFHHLIFLWLAKKTVVLMQFVNYIYLGQILNFDGWLVLNANFSSISTISILKRIIIHVHI